MQFLVFTVCATTGSMGDLAGNEYRGSLRWPGKSAIIGMLAAAKGIFRHETDRFEDLDRLSVCVGLHDGGTPYVDFHTVQTIPSSAKSDLKSRPHAMRDVKTKLETTVTRREYRSGILYTVAVWGEGIEDLPEALHRPLMPLYAGRRACPLSAPVDARLVDANTPIDALRQATLPPWHDIPLCEAYSDPFPGLEGRTVIRNDQPRDRRRWQFSPRTVTIVDVPQELS